MAICSSVRSSPKRSRKTRQRLVGHLLLLVRDVLALAGLAHPVALHGLGEDHRRPAVAAHGLGVGGVDLHRVVAAAVERPDVGVGHVLDAPLELRVGAEEVLAHVRAVARLERLVLAVDGLVHPAAQQPVVVGGQQRVPLRAPDHLEHVPAGAAEHRLELLDDLAVAAHRAVEPLEVAVDDEDQVVQPLAPGQRDRAQRLRLVGLAVAEEGPDLAVRRVLEPAALEVLHEAGLVDRHDRPEAHRHRGELPEVRHQPRVRVGGQPARPRDLLAEAEQLLLAQPALHEGARVDARRRVALHVDEVAAVLVGRGAPEVVEADLVQRRGRLVAGDVAAELGRLLVRAQHRAHRVPADQRADAVLELEVARVRRLPPLRDAVDVRRRRDRAVVGAGRARVLEHAVEQIAGALRPVVRDDGVERLDPLARLLPVYVGVCGHPSRLIVTRAVHTRIQGGVCHLLARVRNRTWAGDG